MLQRILEPEVMDTWEDAVEYDAMDFTVVNTAFAGRALELAPREGLVLDVGTGTARIPILMMQRNRRLKIVATDYSENMLKVGEMNVLAAGCSDRITLQFGDAKGIQFPDHHFDVVISNSLVHHLPDPRPFLGEMERVGKPNSAILIRDLIRPADTTQLEKLVQQYAGACNDYQKKLFRDSLLAALTLEEVQDLVVETGLRRTALVRSSDRHWSIERAWA